ncbi:MAG: restriction endonuclease subunit S, partial [Chloroflexota bacterium]
MTSERTAATNEVPGWVDELPAGWECRQLGQLLDNTPRPKASVLDEQRLIPFIAMNRISAGSIDLSNWELRLPLQVRSGLAVREGDLLLAKITPCLENGKLGIIRGIPGGWGYASTEVYPLRPLGISTEFLAYYLKQQSVRRYLAGKMEGATGRQRLPRLVLDSLLLPVPPLSEQRAIARILRTVQRAKEAASTSITATRELKKSLMHHLFTYGPVSRRCAGGVSTRITDAGEIPYTWQTLRLGDLILDGPQNGLYKPDHFYGRGSPILRIDAFQAGEVIECQALKRLELSDAEVVNYRLNEGDIVVNRVNGNPELVGKCALIGRTPEPTVFESNMMKFSVQGTKVQPPYLAYYLSS